MSAREIKVAPWENVVLRIIAIYKLAKMALFLSIGIGLLEVLRHHHHDMSEIFQTYVIDPMHFDPENRLLKYLLDQASAITPHKIALFSDVAFFYAALFGAEGFGLYFRKRWAEWVVVGSTGSLLPIEFYEIWIHPAWWKVGVVVGNLAIVIYLIHRILLDQRNCARSRSEDDSSGPTGSGKASKLLDHPESASSSDDSGQVVSEVP
jgi:uncharacterized membrane protein (DUF2068 family)